jgi:serine O-acetyltransferase
VVLNEVPPRRTVAGVPARDIGPAGCEEPALAMDQLVQGAEQV